MTRPLHGVVGRKGLVDAFLSHDRESSRDQLLNQIHGAPIAEQGFIGRMIVDKIHHLIRHHVDIRLRALNEIQGGIIHARLDHGTDLVSDLHGVA